MRIKRLIVRGFMVGAAMAVLILPGSAVLAEMDWNATPAEVEWNATPAENEWHSAQ